MWVSGVCGVCGEVASDVWWCVCVCVSKWCVRRDGGRRRRRKRTEVHNKNKNPTHKCWEAKKNMVAKARYLYIIVVEFYCTSRYKKYPLHSSMGMIDTTSPLRNGTMNGLQGDISEKHPSSIHKGNMET